MDNCGSNLVTINSDQHHDVVIDRLWGLMQRKDKVDFRMDVGGRVLQAHDLILGLFFNPKQLLDIRLEYWQGTSLDLLLEFLYLGTVSVPAEQLDTLLELARKLNFTMLTDALLATKNSIQVSRASTSCPGLEIRNRRSFNADKFQRVSNPINSAEVADNATNDWLPLVPKLEPHSDDDTSSKIASTPQIIEPRTVGDQQGVAKIIATNTETDYNVHLSSVSVTIKEEASSEVKSENFESSFEWTEKFEPSSGTDHAEITESQNNVDGLQCSRLESSDDEIPESAGDEWSGEQLYEEVSSAHLKILNVELDSEHRDAVSTNQGEDFVNSRSNELIGVTGSSKPAADTDDVRVQLKKRKRDLYKMLSTSAYVSEKKQRGKKNKNSKKPSRKTSGDDSSSDAPPTDTIKRFQCSFCAKGYDRHSHYLDHYRTHTGETPFKCQVCEKAFHTERGLAKHHLIHTGERPFKCQLCSMSFTVSVNLKRHARVHTGEKPYKCPVCKKRFSDCSTLNVHTRSHTGERPYRCQLCEKAFIKSGDLVKHTRIHTGEKPYACNVCPMAFTSGPNLRRHSRIHTGERAYKCPVCQKAFKDSGNLNAHTRRRICVDSRNVSKPPC